ncbi:hypothetical protein [Nocardioides sp. NPDC006273]|uniref:hypothetical protein n=1 Tax=Nocardioides sp. NPDC006273 TaxID=3155598 RepID=UPI0033AA4440
MTDQVFRMATGHLARWTSIYGVLVGFWTWILLTETSSLWRIIGVVFGLLALRGLAGSVAGFVRRPTLTLSPEAFTVTDVVRFREVPWADCSDFRPIRRLFTSHVRYQAGTRRSSLPAGFGDTNRRLTADELADVLNRARDASSSEPGPAHA